MDKKTCPSCKETKPTTDFYKDKFRKDGLRRICKNCYKLVSKRCSSRWYAIEENKEIYRERFLKRRYGINTEEYNKLFRRQEGVCAICGNPCNTGNRLSVDHSHKTGIVRGLLCNACNRGLGMLQDSAELLRKAADYLEKKYD